MTDKVIMTDKEIKMVDVDKCKYRDSCSNFCLAERDAIGESRTICTGTNCYFKQFQRKKAECEKYEQALNEILEIAQISNMPPCLENEANCDKCDDDVTGNGTKCMQYGLCKIQDIISKAKDVKWIQKNVRNI